MPRIANVEYSLTPRGKKQLLRDIKEYNQNKKFWQKKLDECKKELIDINKTIDKTKKAYNSHLTNKELQKDKLKKLNFYKDKLKSTIKTIEDLEKAKPKFPKTSLEKAIGGSKNISKGLLTYAFAKRPKSKAKRRF